MQHCGSQQTPFEKAEVEELVIVAAVEADLEDIRSRDAKLAGSTLAALALALAREIDEPGNSATSKSMNAHQLRDTMDRLRELSPPSKVRDHVDELRDRRADRRAKAKGGSKAVV